MRISVTAENIRAGVPGHNEKCPIALAARGTKGISDAWLDFGFLGIQLTPKKRRGRLWSNWRNCALPEEARQFVRNFDLGGSVKPFSFEIVLE